ncbi:MAG: sulfatase/phosphatase domain-containing protein, partial [Planctomycetota bacterium]
LIQNPQNAGRDAVFMEYTRFGLPHSTRLGFTPIRCIRTETHKLVINLLDTDELYDLVADPYETVNRINDSTLATLRNELHDRIIDWMDRGEDPFRGNGWWQRSWRPEKMMPPDYDPKIL